ncbi:hypothetical protein GGTG_10357 [Gaeumannomyces tritici R3-111a-1]|uniref:Uncharacterized protein n=1 Tax=Gaeumannomyces tritici (strain R3-111a-1) TaxID=644352 RepID=J3PA34_GAET3|nr:hypothetical protein GGTG_10357 [Gaeumannomyces tritici R3-111a-1]EJT73520.1 hypothetical protein GGTG_10357 [Gaeumannomyces tritici R3-111a-1]
MGGSDAERRTARLERQGPSVHRDQPRTLSGRTAKFVGVRPSLRVCAQHKRCRGLNGPKRDEPDAERDAPPNETGAEY